MHDDYKKAKKRGERECSRAQAMGKSPYLISLGETVEKLDSLSTVPVGVMEIPLSQIAGTVTGGRKTAFSCGFMPILGENTEFAMKWENLYDSQIQEGIRDPIRVLEYRHRFYVQEGNKRVSVMKYLEAGKIAADVVRVMPSEKDDSGPEVYSEFLDYFSRSRLYEIELSGSGAYKELEEILQRAGILHTADTRDGKGKKTAWTPEERSQVLSLYTEFEIDYHVQIKDSDQTLPAGDAFLFYLKVFSPVSLKEGTREDIRRRIARLKKEYATMANENGLRLVNSPEDEKKGRSLLGWISRSASYSESNPLKAAFLYEKPAAESRWVYGHELGREAVGHIFSQLVKTSVYDRCEDEAKTREALEDCAKKGCRLIFTTSPSMMPEALRFAIEHPDIQVFNCSVNLKANAVRTYYCRMYEVKFLTGALAAALSPTAEIGYVSDYPIYGSIASINAFAIGAAMVRPDSRILLKWDTQIGSDWHSSFENHGIHVISGPDFIRPESEVRESGLYARQEGQTIRLAAAMPDWSRYYELIILDALSSSVRLSEPSDDQSVGYWWGLPAGVIQLIFSPKLSVYTRRLIDTLMADIMEGRLQPFSGELKSQDGIIRPAGSGALTPKEIIRMDWLNENVIGQIPASWQFPESARGTLKISGVKKESVTS